MVQIQNGQCGMCVHFGEDNREDRPKLVQIRASHEAPETLVQRCGLPENEKLNLWVSPVSGCDGFAPSEEIQFDAETQNAE